MAEPVQHMLEFNLSDLCHSGGMRRGSGKVRLDHGTCRDVWNNVMLHVSLLDGMKGYLRSLQIPFTQGCMMHSITNYGMVNVYDCENPGKRLSKTEVVS